MKLQDVKNFNSISFKGLSSELPNVVKLKSLVSQVALKVFTTLRDLYLKITGYVFSLGKTPLITHDNLTPDNLKETCGKECDKALEVLPSLNTKLKLEKDGFFKEENDSFIEKSDIEKAENYNLDPDCNAREQSEGFNFSDMFSRSSEYVQSVEVHQNFQVPNISEKVANFFKGFFSKPSFFSTFSCLFSQKISQQQIKAVFSQSKVCLKNTESKDKDSFVINKRSEASEISAQTDEIEIQQVPKQPSMDQSDLTESTSEKGFSTSSAEGVASQKSSTTCNADNFSSTSDKMNVNAFTFLAGNLSSACKKRCDDLWQEDVLPSAIPDCRESFREGKFPTSTPQTSFFRFFESFLLKFNLFNLFSKFSFSKKSDDFSLTSKDLNEQENSIQIESFVKSPSVKSIENVSFSTNDTCFSALEESLDSDLESQALNLQTIKDKDDPIEGSRFKSLISGSTISPISDLTGSVIVSSQSSSNGFTAEGSANSPKEPVLPVIPPPLYLQDLVRENNPDFIEYWLNSARQERPCRRYVSPEATPCSAVSTPVLGKFRSMQKEVGEERSARTKQLFQYMESSLVNTPRSGSAAHRLTLQSKENRSVFDWREEAVIAEDPDISKVLESEASSSIKQETLAQPTQQPNRSKVRKMTKKVVKTVATALNNLAQAQSKQPKTSQLVIEDPDLRLYVKSQPHSKYDTIISKGAFFLTPENMAKAKADLEHLTNAEYQKHQRKKRDALQKTPKVNAMTYVVVKDPVAIEILRKAPQFRFNHSICNGFYEVPSNRLKLLQEAVKSQKEKSQAEFR